MPSFDLQSHSTQSDGALAPAEVVHAAAAAGIALLALSDHDTVDGVDEALAAAEQAGVELVPAAEISAVDAGHEDLHVVGYRLDHRDGALRETLADLRADRGRRAERMVAALRELGWELDERALEERRRDGRPIGRPHIAAAAFEHPANAARVREEGLDDAGLLLERYLTPGASAYRSRTRPTVADAIALIHAAGGVAVWAHPFWDLADGGEVLASLERYRAAGLDGVECFYPTHDATQTRLLHDACARHGMLATGSSDFHGPRHPRFSRFGAFELHGLAPVLGPIAGRT